MCPEGKNRDLDSVQTLSERQNLHFYLEQKAESTVQEENAAQKRLSEVEADVEIRRWEQKSSKMALYETDRELESHRLELHQANQRADQAQRQKINLCGEMEMRKRLFQESRARARQEIEELRRICMNKLSMQQERNPTTVSQLLTHMQDSQNWVNSLSDAREFRDPETASSGASHVPSQLLTIPSPKRNAQLRFWIAA